ARFPAHFHKEREILLAGVLQHEFAKRHRTAFKRLQCVDTAVFEWRDGLLLNGNSHRLHNEVGEKKRKSNESLVGGSSLRAKCLTQEMKDDEDPYKGSHREENRR